MPETKLPRPTAEVGVEYNQLMREHREVSVRIQKVFEETGKTVNAPFEDRTRLAELTKRLNELRETYDFKPEPSLGAQLIDASTK